MAEYFVTIDNEEGNEIANRLSITGTVNGAQCAAIALLGSTRADKQRALVEAYLAKAETPKAGAERVEV